MRFGKNGHSATGHEGSDSARYSYDSSLLFRCMELLQVDCRDFAQGDPLLFRELQGRCALCSAKEACLNDLTGKLNDDRWDNWRAYCPNSVMLQTIGAIQNCGHAAQHLKMANLGVMSVIG